MAIKLSLLKSKRLWIRGPPMTSGVVRAPWITSPTKMKNPPMNSPMAKGSSPIFYLL